MKNKNDDRPYTVKVSQRKLDEAKRLGIHVPDLVREMIDRVIHEKTCPVCKQRIKI